MKSVSPKVMFVFLMALAYTLGTATYLRAVNQVDATQPDEGAFKKLLGDGRKLFAGQFVEMADVYFHSGLYPSIFDRANNVKAAKAVTSAVDEHSDQDDHDEHAGHKHDENGKCLHDEHKDHKHDEQGNCQHDDHDDEHVKAMTPVAENWLESFIHRFRITQHTHLGNGNEREILPWLKLAIELDPQSIETYTTAAYWLRRDLQQPDQAELVLREGLRNNPTNYELLFEMGLLYKENKHDHDRARNLWLAAQRCWLQQNEEARKESESFFSKIASNLGELEEAGGHHELAVKYFEQAKPYSPKPEAIQGWIDRIRAAAQSPTNSTPASLP